MGDVQRKRTNCHFCGYLCGLIATVEDGRVTALEPDPSRYPYDEKILAGCRRWKTNLDQLDSPRRVNHPLRRVGERGSGEWKRVSWDEALGDIAARLTSLREQYGPQTLATAIGGPHSTFWPLHRFMSLWGSPNNMGIGQICWNPRIWMDMITFGWSLESSIIPGVTQSLYIWGTNPAVSDNSAFWRMLREMSADGTPIVVIDPRFTATASIAKLWIAPKPGTDVTLALGFVHVLIEEDLIDHDFVRDWCYGYDELAGHVKSFTPESVAASCGITADEVREGARLMGGGRTTAIYSERGVDQIGPNVAPLHRAIGILRAITGNVDKPGAMILTGMSDFTPEVDLEMNEAMTAEQKAACLNTPYTPLQCYEGVDALRELTMKHGRRPPTRYLASAHPALVWKAVLTGEPYPIRALIVQATNPLLTYGDTQLVYEALMSLDLLVVLEYYKTPTAQLADYILPSAAALERPLIQVQGGVSNIAYGGPKAVEPYYERRADYEFWRGLGLLLGQEEHWPDATLDEAIARQLAAAGMSWDEWCEKGFYSRDFGSYKYLQTDPKTGEFSGFATTTGKVELASEFLPIHGGDRLPLPVETSGTLTQGLSLITGARTQPYYASNYFDNEAFRKTHPHPTAEMSAATLALLGIEPGTPVSVKTDHGSALFRAKEAKMRDGVVSVEYGWWYPEREEGGPGLCGIFESNANLLTGTAVEGGEKLIGTWTYNAIPCTVTALKTSETKTSASADGEE